MSELVYYVLKYDTKYYAPYLDVSETEMTSNVQSMLTEHRELAARFASKDLAEKFKDMECRMRVMLAEPNFNPELVKAVKVTKKLRTIN